MSFKAVLHINGKEFDVLECKYNIRQQPDYTGRPASGISAGIIHFIIESMSDSTFISWISDPLQKRDGTITMYRIDQESKFKEIEFKNGYLVNMFESFITDDDFDAFISRDFDLYHEPVREALRLINGYQHRAKTSYVLYGKISAEKIKIDGIEHNNNW